MGRISLGVATGDSLSSTSTDWATGLQKTRSQATGAPSPRARAASASLGMLAAAEPAPANGKQRGVRSARAARPHAAAPALPACHPGWVRCEHRQGPQRAVIEEQRVQQALQLHPSNCHRPARAPVQQLGRQLALAELEGAGGGQGLGQAEHGTPLSKKREGRWVGKGLQVVRKGTGLPKLCPPQQTDPARGLTHLAYPKVWISAPEVLRGRDSGQQLEHLVRTVDTYPGHLWGVGGSRTSRTKADGHRCLVLP